MTVHIIPIGLLGWQVNIEQRQPRILKLRASGKHQLHKITYFKSSEACLSLPLLVSLVLQKKESQELKPCSQHHELSLRLAPGVTGR